MYICAQIFKFSLETARKFELELVCSSVSLAHALSHWSGVAHDEFDEDRGDEVG
jgi:hypothetical protein